MQNNIILFKIMIYLFIFSLLNTSQNEVLCSSKQVQITNWWWVAVRSPLPDIFYLPNQKHVQHICRIKQMSCICIIFQYVYNFLFFSHFHNVDSYIFDPFIAHTEAAGFQLALSSFLWQFPHALLWRIICFGEFCVFWKSARVYSSPSNVSFIMRAPARMLALAQSPSVPSLLAISLGLLAWLYWITFPRNESKSCFNKMLTLSEVWLVSYRCFQVSIFLNVLWGVCSVREKQETTITLQSQIVAHIVPLTEAQFYSNRCFLKPTRTYDWLIWTSTHTF